MQKGEFPVQTITFIWILFKSYFYLCYRSIFCYISGCCVMILTLFDIISVIVMCILAYGISFDGLLELEFDQEAHADL